MPTVLISGHDGGTGASPLSSIKHTGCPWELGLAETQQVLVLNGLRDRIRLQVDGQMKTGRDVVVAALLGAEQFGFGTAALVTLGCTLLRKCHEGACVYGIATQDPELRARFAGKPEYLTRFMFFVAEEVRQIMAQLGFRTFEEMIGRRRRLQVRTAVEHYKAKGLDFSALLAPIDAPEGTGIRLTTRQPNKLDDHLDWFLIENARAALDEKRRSRSKSRSAHHRRRYDPQPHRHPPRPCRPARRNHQKSPAAAPPDKASALLAPGVTLNLIGESNDYLGRASSGGRIVVKPRRRHLRSTQEHHRRKHPALWRNLRRSLHQRHGRRTFAVRNSGRRHR